MSKQGLAVGLLLFALALLLHPVGTTATSPSPVAGKRIALDPGHGGDDPGTTACEGLPEKEATLEIALLLEAKLLADDALVKLTRRDDTNLSTAERADIANNFNADALVSIHLNSNPNDPTYNKTLGLYGKRPKDYKFAQVLLDTQVELLGTEREGLRQFASRVLLDSKMPATITESVYLSNPEECQQFTDGTGERQEQIAAALHEGLKRWFKSQSTP